MNLNGKNREKAERVGIRVFVSSTFRDMHAERDELAKHVFPRLRRLCEKRGLSCGEVDLRWGITDEQQAEGRALSICFEEIDRCRPFFIGVLGHCYGSLPERIPDDLKNRQPWLREYQHRSVTELEMLYGALNNIQTTSPCFFYLRDPSYGNAPQTESAEKSKALNALKNRIRNSGLPVRENYPNPKAFGELVYADLAKVIESRFPERELSPLDRDAADHDFFAESRLVAYVEREEYSRRLNVHLTSNVRPLVLVGDSGVGKSTLLASCGLEHKRNHPEDLVLLHFLGCTAQSTNWAAMLHRMLGELHLKLGLELDFPTEHDQLRTAFFNALHMAAAKTKVLLVLDGLDQLEDRDGAQDLVWLPRLVPANVHLVLSTRPGPPLNEINRRDWPKVEVQPFTLHERGVLIKKYLKEHAHELGSKRLEQISSAEQTGNPLYLRTLLEELLLCGVHERLDERIASYLQARDPSELYRLILKRYEEDYETYHPGLVRETMTALWAARRGLSEPELLELLGTEGEPVPYAHWAPLSLAIERILVNRAGLLGFAHDYLRTAVQQTWILREPEQRAAHWLLGKYFAQQESTERTIDELPWQLVRAQRWTELREFIAKPSTVTQISENRPSDILEYLQELRRHTQTSAPDIYREIIDHPEKYDSRTVDQVCGLVAFQGFLGEQMSLRKRQEEIARQSGEHAALGWAILQVNSVRSQRMDYNYEERIDEAESIFRSLRDLKGLARCLGQRANCEKYLRHDWAAALRFHKEQEAVLRHLGDTSSSLEACLNNQAVMYGRIGGEFARQMTLYEQVETLVRSKGDLDGLARNQANQGMTLLSRARLERYSSRTSSEKSNKGYAMLTEAERLFRILGKVSGLAGVLRRWAEAIFGDIDFPDSASDRALGERISLVALPKAREALSIYCALGIQSEIAHMEKLIRSMEEWLESATLDQILFEGLGLE